MLLLKPGIIISRAGVPTKSRLSAPGDGGYVFKTVREPQEPIIVGYSAMQRYAA